MTENTSPEMRADFLKAMRNVANSVTVVTTDGPGGKQGATVSSFCSVSADPPTVLVCLNQSSRIYDAVRENGTFCVNVLPEGADEQAMVFAGAFDTKSPDRFAGTKTKANSENTVVMQDTTAFECTTEQEVPSGSHTIFIGRVAEIHDVNNLPLVYLDGKFRKIEGL